MAPHNHVTRDVKQPGQCPGCDDYHRRPGGLLGSSAPAPPQHRVVRTPEEAVAQWVASGRPEYVTSVQRTAFPLLMDAVAEGLPDPLTASVGITHGRWCPCWANRQLPMTSCSCDVVQVRLRLERPQN